VWAFTGESSGGTQDKTVKCFRRVQQTGGLLHSSVRNGGLDAEAGRARSPPDNSTRSPGRSVPAQPTPVAERRRATHRTRRTEEQVRDPIRHFAIVPGTALMGLSQYTFRIRSNPHW